MTQREREHERERERIDSNANANGREHPSRLRHREVQRAGTPAAGTGSSDCEPPARAVFAASFLREAAKTPPPDRRLE
jgi:hypothetical protein